MTEGSAKGAVPSAGMEYNVAFLRSIRGVLKIAELVTVFVAFICFATATGPSYIAATCMEFLLTSALILLYVLKLNKKITLFFWPLIDVFNSLFAAMFMFVISMIAVTNYSAKGTLGGGIMGLMATGLWCGDAFLLFRKVTFNQVRTASAPVN
ncbi:chemokine-like factor [Megalops cyprinoides]|uniref:chemokine-like factor n=1 Tax=Megalops cyprinoides TaxID=118141 RepID=UPI001863DBFB|nr:chemokine-like factor [Megalops cyprinoides]